MKVCLCCNQCDIKPTFSFSSRWCYIYLQQRYGLDDTDYIKHFKIMYNKKAVEKYSSYNSLFEIHNNYEFNLRITDKPLAELLEAILFKTVF